MVDFLKCHNVLNLGFVNGLKWACKLAHKFEFELEFCVASVNDTRSQQAVSCMTILYSEFETYHAAEIRGKNVNIT